MSSARGPGGLRALAGRVWALARRPIVRRVFSIVCFAAAVWLIWTQLAQISFGDFLTALLATPAPAVVASVALTLASYLCLSGTEWLSLRAWGLRLGYWQTAQVAIPSYALTNSAGFSPATGTVIRVQLYAPRGLTAAQSTQVAMLAGAAVTVSGIVAGGAMMLLRRRLFTQALHVPEALVIAAALALMAPASLWFAAFTRGAPRWLGGSPQRDLSVARRALGLAAGLGDWVFSCAALFVLLPRPQWQIFPGFFWAYIAGSVLSAATGVPGGVGVFEAIMLLLTHIVARAHETAAALLLYRCIYSFGPLGLISAYALLGRLRMARAGKA
jgi:phosphatidylglycerol lysyltransferase